ncbi:ras association domain-containing protein 6-like, partial [Scleropages formosus]
SSLGFISESPSAKESPRAWLSVPRARPCCVTVVGGRRKGLFSAPRGEMDGSSCGASSQTHKEFLRKLDPVEVLRKGLDFTAEALLRGPFVTCARPQRNGHQHFGVLAEFSSLLNTYNCFLKDKPNQHLTVYETGHDIRLDGLLVIFWGIRRPIRLKIQDEKPNPSPKSPDPTSPLGGKRGMTRWGEFDDLHHIDEMEETMQEIPEPLANDSTGPREYESSTLRTPRLKAALEEASNLFRSMSDASLVKKRTSIFTPCFGTPTNVRINSKMTTNEVIVQLLKKFKVENDPKEFALYCIHQSGEKRKLSDLDFPLWERVLQGPSENIMRMFLMDTDEQEVSNDVAQYLNLELPLLEAVLHRLEEEEEREIARVIAK